MWTCLTGDTIHHVTPGPHRRCSEPLSMSPVGQPLLQLAVNRAAQVCFLGDERLGHERRGQNTQVHLSVCLRRVRRIPQVEVTVENGGIGVSKYPSVAFLPFSVSPVGEQQVMASLVIVPKGCVFCCTVTTQAEAERVKAGGETPCELRRLHPGEQWLLEDLHSTVAPWLEPPAHRPHTRESVNPLTEGLKALTHFAERPDQQGCWECCLSVTHPAFPEVQP
ncbi:uncharacterized protein RBU33_010537 isoform 1-T1 [Hipposideros larvatus]